MPQRETVTSTFSSPRFPVSALNAAGVRSMALQGFGLSGQIALPSGPVWKGPRSFTVTRILVGRPAGEQYSRVTRRPNGTPIIAAVIALGLRCRIVLEPRAR